MKSLPFRELVQKYVLWTYFCTTALALPASAAGAQDAPAEPEVVIEGKGWGHGVGLPQDGALALGLEGASVDDILGTFFPGTEMDSRSGRVRVRLFDGALNDVVVSFPSGGEISDSLTGTDTPGLPVVVRSGGSVRVSFDGEYRVTPLNAAAVTRRPAPAENPAEPVFGAPVWAVPNDESTVALPEKSTRYRGRLQLLGSGGGLEVVNHLDVEEYLRGMGEVQAPSWPAAALQAQAISARTYALRYAAAGQTLCSSQQCQVYLGQTAEYSAMDGAVAATEGQVVTYDGRLAEVVYSASAGGITATAEEGFGPGSPEYPYLQAVPYPTGDERPWAERMTLRALAARAGYPGEAADVKVTRTGPSGRPLEITFTGDADAYTVTGVDLWGELGLQSTLFGLRVERPVEPAPAPAPAGTASGHARGADVAPGIAGRPPAQVIEAVTADDDALGRAPWVAFALVLIVSAAAATVSAARRPARAGGRRRYTAPLDSTAASP